MVDVRAEFADALVDLTGSLLERVCYRSSFGPPIADPLDSGFLDCLQEVKLCFHSGRVAFVTWGQGRGWRGDCSLIVSEATLGRRPYVYLEADASQTPAWQPHIGQELLDVQVLGWRSTPYLLRLAFPSGALLVGTGSLALDSFGDGLDVLVRPNETRYLSHASLLWRQTR